MVNVLTRITRINTTRKNKYLVENKEKLINHRDQILD